MDLIAQLMFESRIGAYIEWLGNELIMTAKKHIYKDSLLVMLFCQKGNPATIKPIISFGVGKLFPLVG